jgi:hypothetical protein
VSDEDPGEESIPLVQVLECEVCRAHFSPEAFGYASCDKVPDEVSCPRCGGGFSIADCWPDDEEGEAGG